MIYTSISIFMSIILTVFATGVMSYLSMATPIGPWIAPTLVLCSLIFVACVRLRKSQSEFIALVTASGSIGGILATACGFSFPTLYFADKEIFSAWMAHPYYFAGAVGGLTFVAGAFGMWVAHVCEDSLLEQEHLSFPIGQLVHKMITASQQLRKAYELVLGFVSSFVFSILQDGIWKIPAVMPKSIPLIAGSRGVIALPVLRFDLWPLLWAVGFVAGPLIAVPLLIGALSKVMVIDPINVVWFSSINSTEFVLAFCSGMVLSGALMSFAISPRALWQMISRYSTKGMSAKFPFKLRVDHVIEGLVVCVLALAFLSYFKMPFLAKGYLLLTTALCTYQIAVIAGKIGLAQLGRWATFVMVPALFLFKLDMVQIVFIATFVELSGGIAADVLFGSKLAQLSHIPRWKMHAYQYLGLIITSLCIGAIFWLLIHHLHLGSEQLFAQRAQARQLLIAVQSFNYIVLILGFIFGFVLKWIKLNPMLVLGGLLMPLNITIGLLTGALIHYLIKHDQDKYIPFWSGVFAAGSVWMLLRSLI